MTRLRVHIHVAEPWNFDRYNPTSELIGWTIDHADADNEDWLVHLEERFTMNDHGFSRVMITPRYHGEQLARIVDTLASVSIDIGHRVDGDWLYDMVGTIAQKHGEN